ncbi:MAG: PAS domain S-box protein [Anaerolineae bacterium]|nr:PAS domain S-box protein [Anaerolineae bacterium]
MSQRHINLYRLMLKTIPNLALIVYDRELRYVTAEGSLLQPLGFDPAAMLGKHINEVLPSGLMPSEAWAKLEPLYQAVLVGQEINFDASFNAHLFHVRVLPVKDERGDVYAGMIVMRDITEQHQTEGALRASEERYRLLVDNYLDAVLLTDPNGMILMANDEACSMFGYTLDQLLLVRRDALIDQTDPRLPEAARTQEQSGAFRGELRFVKADSATFPAELSWKMYYNAKGQPQYLMVIRDLTERKRTEAQGIELQLQRERVHLLTDFIRDVSHDFRTPLAIIQSSAYLIGKMTDPDRQKDYQDKIVKQVKRLETILDEMMTMLRLDSKDEFVPHPMRPNQLLRDAVQNLAPETTAKQLKIGFALDDTLPLIYGDPDELYEAFVHIIENAVRFTPISGAISVGSRQTEQAVVIDIIDTGIGIPATELERIFEPFYRADKSRSSQTGGAGLGLSIAKRIVELHDGTLEVESVEGKGSTFRITLRKSPPVSTKR